MKGIIFSIQRAKYELLLLSFLVLIFGNTFIYHVKVFDILNIYQNMVIGLLVFFQKKTIRSLILGSLIFSLSLDVIQSFYEITISRNLHSINYLMFFFVIAVQVFKALLYSKTVTRELLSAALCGFVLLCLICTFLFFLIESGHHSSFSNLGADNLASLNYFSFTTLLTIGYGDIAPLTLTAKRAVMMMGLLGHFYTVFVTSIIIGKYLSVKNQ